MTYINPPKYVAAKDRAILMRLDRLAELKKYISKPGRVLLVQRCLDRVIVSLGGEDCLFKSYPYEAEALDLAISEIIKRTHNTKELSA